jgi:hypothetical protein
MKTKVRKHKNKRKSLKRATKNATKKATKRQKKSLNYKNKNTRKNKKGGDATSVAVPIAVAAMIAGLVYKSQKKNTNPPTGTKINTHISGYQQHNNNKHISGYPQHNNNTHISGYQQHNNTQIREDETLDFFLKKHHLVKEPIPDDGNCLFTAFLKFLNTPDDVLYKNRGKSPHGKPQLSRTGLDKVVELRKEMVEWMQSDDSIEDGETFLEKNKVFIIEQDPYYDNGDEPVRKKMYDDLKDYMCNMKRIVPDDTRKKAQFGTQIEIVALVKMHFKEPKFLQCVVVGDNGSLTLNTIPDKSDVDLHSIKVNMPILLLKDGHFEILKHDEKIREKRLLGNYRDHTSR